jgi:hypothetical protein
MLLQPGGDRFNRAVWEEVNGQTQLQVTDEGSIAQSALAWSGKRMALPPFPPLRTGRVSFLTSGSSLSVRPCHRTRLPHEKVLAVNLLMAGWMEQNAISCGVSSSL